MYSYLQEAILKFDLRTEEGLYDRFKEQQDEINKLRKNNIELKKSNLVLSKRMEFYEKKSKVHPKEDAELKNIKIETVNLEILEANHGDEIEKLKKNHENKLQELLGLFKDLEASCQMDKIMLDNLKKKMKDGGTVFIYLLIF